MLIHITTEKEESKEGRDTNATKITYIRETPGYKERVRQKKDKVLTE